MLICIYFFLRDGVEGIAGAEGIVGVGGIPGAEGIVGVEGIAGMFMPLVVPLIRFFTLLITFSSLYSVSV